MFLEGPEYEKYQHYIDVRGEVLPTPRGTTAPVLAATQKYLILMTYGSLMNVQCIAECSRAFCNTFALH